MSAGTGPPARRAARRPLGRGFIDYRPIFAVARGVKHYFVEQEPPYREFTALEAARIGYQYLQGLG